MLTDEQIDTELSEKDLARESVKLLQQILVQLGGGVTVPTEEAVTIEEKLYNIQSVPIEVSSPGANIIIPASSLPIKVIAYLLQSKGDVEAQWLDGDTNPLTGNLEFGEREGVAESIEAPSFLFDTQGGNALILNLSAAIEVVGHVTYFDSELTQ